MALVVDDEMSIRLALKRFLTRQGWEVEEAEDGAVALEKLLRHRDDGREFTVVISDLRMPGCSGMELHEQLSRQRPHLLGRLIFSTGDVVSAEAAAFVSRTRCPVLQKPFELAALRELIEQLRAGVVSS
jgi:DNA-binding NtrC family response regulator